MSRIQHTIFVVILMTALTACATVKHTPPLDIPPAPYMPPNYGAIMEPVSVQNQTDDSINLTGKVLTLTFQANLSEYGDAVVSLLERELKKNGVQIDQAATRAIGIVVTDVELVYPKRYRCDLNVAVFLGDETLGIEGVSTIEGMDVKKIIDSAIADAVRKILHDEKFVALIQKTPSLGN